MDTNRANSRRGFTLTELLIVIGLIVLVVAIAVPTFRAMSGGRSVDAAQNQLSAILGAARAEAVALQKVRGVFFYYDPATERVNAALVQEGNYRPEPGDPPPPAVADYYLDLVPDRDPITLPTGVGLQGIDNVEMSDPATRQDDGYTGFNPVQSPGLASPDPGRAVLWGGVILFDGYGRVVNKFYGFHIAERGTGAAAGNVPTLMGELLGYLPGGAPTAKLFVPEQSAGRASGMNKRPPLSLFGFVLYDASAFGAQDFGGQPGTVLADPQFNSQLGSYGNPEAAEERWLDENAAPVLINRYNGTLVRGE